MGSRRRLVVLSALFAACGLGVLIGVLAGSETKVVTRTRTRTERVFIATGHAFASRRAPEPDRVNVGVGETGAPFASLVPVDATLVTARLPRAPTPAALIVWQRGFGSEPPYVETGVALWYRPFVNQVASWRRVFSLEATEFGDGVEGMRVETTDLTGDGREDFLVFEDTDGSAGCGLYRVYRAEASRARQLWSRQACSDWTATFFEHHRLVTEDGVGQTAASKDSIHCCPRFIRRTEYRWNGSALVVARRTLRRAK